MHALVDLEYWKMPSRRFYITSRAEFQNLRRTKGRALSFSRKRKGVFHLDEDEEEDNLSLGHVAQDLEKVIGTYTCI